MDVIHCLVESTCVQTCMSNLDEEELHKFTRFGQPANLVTCVRKLLNLSNSRRNDFTRFSQPTKSDTCAKIYEKITVET